MNHLSENRIFALISFGKLIQIYSIKMKMLCLCKYDSWLQKQNAFILSKMVNT